MPTYTYRCSKCGEEIEVFQSMSDPPLKRCKICRGALRRTFHPVGIVLKGSGFYKTDSRSGSGSGSSGGEKRGSSESSASDGPKSKDSSGSGKDSGGGDAKGSGSGTTSGDR